MMVIRKINYWKQAKAAFRSPAMVIGDVWDFFGGWRRSRKWTALMVCSPIFLIALTTVSLVAWGKLQSNQTLQQWYVELAEKEAPIDPLAMGNETDKKDLSESSENNASLLSFSKNEKDAKNDKAFVYFRRVMDLNMDNKRAKYYVAARLANRGSDTQARRMMEMLAPSKSEGYQPAHAWLAIDLIKQQSRGLPINLKNCMHHLDIATAWPNVAPQLQLLYSELLLRSNVKEKALSMAQLAASRDGNLALRATVIAKAAGEKTITDLLADRTIRFHESRLQQNDDSEQDLLAVAQAWVFKEDFVTATNVLAKALQKFPQLSNVRRGLSSILTERFRKSVQDDEKGFAAKFEYLQDALAVDPLNPAIGEEIARLAERKVALTDSLQASLREQLAKGSATTITHLLISNANIKSGKFDVAKRHLEIGLEQSPNAAVVMNNLAMVLTRVKDPELERASKLIDRALQLDPGNAEYHDSRARIQMDLKNTNAAIASFEKCLSLDPRRMSAREELVKLYEEAGLPEMAQAQRSMIERINQMPAPPQTPVNPAGVDSGKP